MAQICKNLITALLAVISLSAAAQNTRQLHIVSTGDVHGSWFDQPYVDGGKTKTSLMSVKVYVDSLRQAVGADNVLLLDAGDSLQGDNAAYYFNRVADPEKPHLFPRIMKYMGYDAVAVGNHDIETGHKVYDRILKEMTDNDIPWLGGNVMDISDGSTYFPMYRSFYKAGVKVTVLGFENANMEAWLPEELYSGMSFLSLVPYVQAFVDYVVSIEKPQVVVVVAHTGTGEGDGGQLESQGLDLFNSLKGVDVLIGGHDHRPYVTTKQGLAYVNSGSRVGNVGHAVVELHTQGRKVIAKDVSAEICRIDKSKVDWVMEDMFKEDFEAVKAFTNQEVGTLSVPLASREAYAGMSDYVNLIHTVQLNATGARVSFAAPLSFNGKVKSGTVVFNDMFTIYPYENQLYVMNLKGSEIKNYLELSYDKWIQTSADHVLLIQSEADPRTGTDKWSFVNRSYNFDSAAGLVYTVDVTKPFGSRVVIKSFADGSAFDESEMYPVAMTSYRASGGGGLVYEGAGLAAEVASERICARHPEIRDLVYAFIAANKVVDRSVLSDEKVIGSWKFIPEDVVEPLMKKDISLLF